MAFLAAVRSTFAFPNFVRALSNPGLSIASHRFLPASIFRQS